MASRQSVSSILKPQKVRAPLKEIESVDQDVDEDTATMPKKKVSFSGMNNIKMFIASASSLTVPTLLDEQISMMSDSSNGDKTKLSGKLEKSDGQITIESTNCTNMEENGRVVIEYESPNDNMEMTEALSGKIFSDTVYNIDNNISEHNECTLDYSANNMEFTEAVALGQIFTVDLSNSSHIEMSETFINTDEQPNNTQLKHNNSVSLREINSNNTSCSHSDNMEFTQANIKSHPTNLTSMNESSNMELTYVSSAPLKSNCLNEDQNVCSMVVLTHDKQLFEDNFESETTDEVNENSNCKLEIIHDLYPKTPKDNNCLNNENVICDFENSKIDEEIVGKLSSSMVSMDIDSESKCNEYDISYVNMDCSKLNTYDQTYPIAPTMLETENKEFSVKDVHDDYSNDIEILKHTYSDVKTTMIPTSSSFVQDTPPKKNLNKSIVVQEPQLKSMLSAHAPILNGSDSLEMDTSLEVEEIWQRNYSRKTLIHSAPLIIPKESFLNEDMVNTSALVEENHPKLYSRKSIRLTSVIDQNSFKKGEDNFELPDLIEENQNKCTVKSNSSTSNFEQIQSQEKDVSVSSVIIENNQPRYPRKSIACLSMLNKVQSPEKMNLSIISMHDNTQVSKKENTSVMVEKNLKKKYSRRTFGPTSIQTLNNFSNNTDSNLSNSSFVISGTDISNNALVSSIDDYDHSNDVSFVSNNSKINHVDLDLNLSNHEKNLVEKGGHQSLLHNVIDDDDLNSPFKKKSKTNMSSLQLSNLSVYDIYEKNTETSNNKENKSDNTIDVCNTENDEYSKMDISIEAEEGDNCVEKITSREKDATLSTSLLNNMSLLNQPSIILTDQQFCDNSSTYNLMNDLLDHNSRETNVSLTKKSNFSVVLDTLQEDRELKKIVYDDACEKVVVPNEVEQNETHFNEVNEGNVNFIESNDKNNDESFGRGMNTNNICCDEISNMSISDNGHQKYRKSCLENRKRSYSNLGNAPLSCSSFMYKPNDCNTEKYNEDNFLKESPIKKVSEISLKTELIEENAVKEDIINEGSVKEHLISEVTEFLRKWNDLYFIENKLVLATCNNSEWIFNMLDNNIKLTIKYSPILDDNSYLKVEDIMLITQYTTEDEIIKFGTNWILSKYSPKVYKQICFTSRDVELLLKSLQDDIQFISLVMKNMVIVRDVYCVTFKDNKAQFYLQSMHPLLMACIDVSLVNIHKLSVKDITVDCLFGVFDLKVLDELMDTLTKDCNVLQYLVENLKKSIRTIQKTS